MENQNNIKQEQNNFSQKIEQKVVLPKIIVPKALPEYEIRHHPFHYRGKLYEFNPKPMKKAQAAPDQALLSTVVANIKLLNDQELNRVFDLIDKIAEDRKKMLECTDSNYLEVVGQIKLMKQKRAKDKRSKKQVEKARFNPPVINLDEVVPRSNKLDPGQKVRMEMDKEDIIDALATFAIDNQKERNAAKLKNLQLNAKVDAIYMNRPEYRYTCDFGEASKK